MEAGRRAYRTIGVVRDQVDVVGLAPPRDLLALGDARADGRVDAGVVDQVLLDELAVLPFAGELLACRQRHTAARPQGPIAVRILRAQRVLHEVGPVRFDRAAQRGGVDGVEPRVHVQADLHVLTQGRAHGLALMQQRAHRLARLQHVARTRQAPAHELVAQRARAPTALDQGLYAAVFAGIVRVADHLIADASPEQLVDRHAVRLARDVPQRRVDRPDGRRPDASGRQEAAAEEYLPEVPDA